jgi:hypothetical protein
VPGPAARLIEAALATADDAPIAGRGRAFAVGWATVDLDRAVVELAADLDVPPAAFLPAADSEALGARSRVAPGVLSGGGTLAILEPATEGRLAAILARSGEGPRVVWIEPDDGWADGHGPVRPGPFGPERPVTEGSGDGLYRFLARRPGTIGP